MVRKYDDSEGGIAGVTDAIKDGGVAVYPTETCYGIGGNALNRNVIDRVYELKQRPREKGLTVIVTDLAMAEQYCRLNTHERHLCESFMPGPLTLVAEKKRNVPDALNDKFVFRVPGSETARALAERAGVPVIATSANISGQPANYRVDTIDERILHNVDAILDAGELERQQPSTIVEVADHNVRMHRTGPVSREDIEGVLNG